MLIYSMWIYVNVSENEAGLGKVKFVLWRVFEMLVVL